MTVAVPIQVFLVASWIFGIIGGGLFVRYAKESEDARFGVSVIILIFSFVLLVIGTP